jgi:hypothetical protein
VNFSRKKDQINNEIEKVAIKSSKRKINPNLFKNILFILLLLILIVSIGIIFNIVYSNKSKKVIFQQKTPTIADKKPGQVGIKTLPSSKKNNNSGITSQPITDISLKINNVPPTLSGFTAYYDSATSTAYISTSALAKADNKCSAENKIGIGSITKFIGDYQKNPIVLPTNQTFLKQFNGYYFILTSPKAKCSANDATNRLQAELEKNLNAVLYNNYNLVSI